MGLSYQEDIRRGDRLPIISSSRRKLACKQQIRQGSYKRNEVLSPFGQIEAYPRLVQVSHGT